MLLKYPFDRVEIVYGTFSVNAASAAGTPGHSAIPKVARPDPACDKKLSACP